MWYDITSSNDQNDQNGQDVQKMWNDAVLHKYPDDISSHTDQQQTMLFFLSKLIDGLYQQGQADHHQE